MVIRCGSNYHISSFAASDTQAVASEWCGKSNAFLAALQQFMLGEHPVSTKIKLSSNQVSKTRVSAVPYDHFIVSENYW
jgi:hypothetical protein